MQQPHKKLLVITGPTATGKSALAIEIAKRFHGEIISADSRQVYKGLDIGSAKVTLEEMEGVPHHLIDVADPKEVFNVSEFKKLATEKIELLHKLGKLPILVGGTGMYISAVVDGAIFPEVPPNEKLRLELEKKTTNELFHELQALDSVRALNVDKHNRVRLIRAIEVAKSLGSVPKPIKEIHPYDVLTIGLELPKEELVQRITDRIEARIPALFEEIKNLHDSGISFERLYAFGLEYRYGAEYVQKKITLDEFKKTLATRTWQFVKRQMTWFKRDKKIHWLNPIVDKEKIMTLVKEFTIR